MIQKSALQTTEMSGFRAKTRHFLYIKQNSIAEIVSTMESFLVAELGFDIAHVVEVRFVRRVICYLAVRIRQMTQYAAVATADIDPDSARFLLCDLTLIYKVIFWTEQGTPRARVIERSS